MKKRGLIMLMVLLMLSMTAISPTFAVVPPPDFPTFPPMADVYVDDDADPGWYDATHVATIQEGIDNASMGGTVFVYDGYYNEDIDIDKSLTLLGNGSETVEVEVPTSESYACSIEADDVLIEGFYFYQDGHPYECMFTVPKGGAPPNFEIIYSNITFSRCSFNHTRRMMIVYAEDFTVKNCSFSNSYRDSIYGIFWNATFEYNHFYNAGRKSILFEGGTSIPTCRGDIIIRYNTVYQGRHLFVWGDWGNKSETVDFYCYHNSIDSTAYWAMSFFAPTGSDDDFEKFSTIEIRDNIVTNSVYSAVYVDYEWGAGSGNPVPANDQIEVFNNLYYNVNETYPNTVSDGQHGYFNGSACPAGMSMDAFDLYDNEIDMFDFWTWSDHGDDDFSFLKGCMAYQNASDGGNIGAWQGHPEVWVNDDADPGWYDENHVETVEEGISTVSDKGYVYVYEGTYTLTDELYVDKPLTMQGLGERENTIIQRTGGNQHRLLTIEDLWDEYVVVDGFTFQGGYANMTNRNGVGGNILIVNSLNATVNNSIIKDGFSEQYGGGIQLEAGGQLKNSTVYDCDVTNSGMNAGGGVSLRYGGNIVEYCYITNCSAPVGGGMIIKMGASPPYQNKIIHCTIANNTAHGYLSTYYGGGIISQGSGWSTTEINDTIVYHNTPNNIVDIDGSLNVYYSCTTPSWGGSGSNNINSDPEFEYDLDYTNPEYYYALKNTSECRDNASDGENIGAWLEPAPPLNQPPDQVDEPEVIYPINATEYETVYITNFTVTVSDPDLDTLTVYFYWQNGTLIGSVSDVVSGENATYERENPGSVWWMNHDQDHYWYVIVDDGIAQVQSDTWQFRTSKAWDCNEDRDVDYLDVSLLSPDYGTSGSLPGEKRPDIVEDGAVQYLDVSSLVFHYGESY